MRILLITFWLLILLTSTQSQINQNSKNETPSAQNQRLETVKLDKQNYQDQEFSNSDKLRLLDERKSKIAELLNIVNNNTPRIENLTFYRSDDVVPIVVEVLGAYRAEEAVSLLMKIKSKVVREQVKQLGRREPVPVFNYFFAAKALAAIGPLSGKEILYELTDGREYSILNTQLNALILKEIYGDKISLCILSEQYNSSLSSENAIKLTIAKEIIEQYDGLSWYFDGKKLAPDINRRGK